MESKDKIESGASQELRDAFFGDNKTIQHHVNTAKMLESLTSPVINPDLISKSRVLEELEGLAKSCQEQAELFKHNKMETSELCSKAMGQAYNSAIERIKNLK